MELLHSLLKKVASGQKTFAPDGTSFKAIEEFQSIAQRLISAESKCYLSKITVHKSSGKGFLYVSGVQVIEGLTFEGELFLQQSASKMETQSQMNNHPNVITTDKSPKYFVSHATKDKDRFVTSFAKKLTENGVDVWYDQWDVLLGDKLVKKVFDGIEEADGMIAIISKNSAERPWVMEEIEAGFMGRCRKGFRIIPILIDDCPVPHALISTRWLRINDLINYEAEFKQLLCTIHGYPQKPKIGKIPDLSESIQSFSPSSENTAGGNAYKERTDAELREIILQELYKNRKHTWTKIKPDMFSPEISLHDIFRIAIQLRDLGLAIGNPGKMEDYYYVRISTQGIAYYESKTDR